MVYFLIVALTLSTGTFNFSCEEVLNVTNTILAEREITLQDITDSKLVTEHVGIDIEEMNNYITENCPDENPGWTKGRFYLTVEVIEIEEASEVRIEVFFERFGVPSALLLLPPAWTSVPSNNTLEQEILREIEERLTITPEVEK
jgi:hypothetical protein